MTDSTRDPDFERYLTTELHTAMAGAAPAAPARLRSWVLAIPEAEPAENRVNRLLPIALVAAAAVVVAILAVAALWRPAPNIGPPPGPSGSEEAVSSDIPAGVQNGAIVVLEGSDGAFSAFSIAPDGSRTDLGLGVESASCPTFAPDGRLLAYLTSFGTTDSGQLIVVNPDGSGQQVLWSGTVDGSSFHQVIWSPDGRYMAATHAVGSNGGQVVVGQANGGSAIVLDWSVGEFPGTLTWSPTSDRLAATIQIQDQVSGIEIRDLSGGSGTTIVTAPEIRSVAWSPDGQTIAYTVATVQDGSTDLYLVDVDGSNPRPMGGGTPGREGFMAWSPDGRLLAVNAHDPAGGTFRTRILDFGGSDVGLPLERPELGPFDATPNLSFTWAPDGSALLYTTAGGRQSLSGGPPLIAPVDGGPTSTVNVGSDFYTQCPLAWQAVHP